MGSSSFLLSDAHMCEHPLGYAFRIKMMACRRIRSLVAGGCVLLSLSNHANGETAKILGAGGALSCSAYLNAPESINLAATHWVLGFLSALSFDSSNDQGFRSSFKQLDTDALESALIQTCKNNPAMTVATATIYIYRYQLGGTR